MEQNAISFYSGHTYVIERVSRKNNAEKHYTVNVVSAEKHYTVNSILILDPEWVQKVELMSNPKP